MSPSRSDPVRLEVFHHLFAATAEEMGATLMRSAFSANIKERRDFSCALFDAAGRMVSQAAHIPIHLGSVPLCVAAAMRALGPDGWESGDAVILNDPYQGGTHLPDVTLVSPVFLGGAGPEFFVANRAHHADVGGAHPGSMAPVDDVHAEGLRIPPTKLVCAGIVDRPLMELLLANMRVPAEREGDLLAQWSANRVGAKRLAALAAEHSPAELALRAAGLMNWTERLLGSALANFPEREVRFEDHLELPGTEARGHAGNTVALRATLRVRGSRMTVDLRDTDDQVGAGLNTPRAVALSAVFYCLRLLLPPGTPTNDGILRRVDVLTRPGSLVDASYPAPVAAGNVETSQRLVDVLLGALGELRPDTFPAASAGTMSNLTFGGEFGGRAFTYYETIAGGAGASARGSGAHALQTHMTNTRNTPIEAFENAYPVRVVECTVRRGSGGSGRGPGGAAGGDGVSKRLRFLAPARIAWVADRQRTGPWGLGGAAPGAPGGARLLSAGQGGKGARATPLDGKATLSVGVGDELQLDTPGGGGFGRSRARSRRHG